MNSMLFDSGGVDIVAYMIVVPSLFLVTMLAVLRPGTKSIKDRANRSSPLRIGGGLHDAPGVVS